MSEARASEPDREPHADPDAPPVTSSEEASSKEASSKEASSEEASSEEAGRATNSEGMRPPTAERAGSASGAPKSEVSLRARERRASRAFVLFLAAVAAVAAGIFFHHARKPEPLPPPAPKADLLDAVPTSPMLLFTVDLDALRASRLGALVASQEGAGILGRVRATCGFEPVDSLREVALVVPASQDDADFGLVAVGDVDQAAIVGCAEKVIGARGGTPVTTTLGSFRAVRDASTASGEIAVRAGGPLLVGAGNYLRTMVDTADGALPTVRTDSAHAALRAAIADVPLARVSIVLSPRQRATIADEVRRTGGRAPSALTSVLAAALGAKITPEIVQIHGVVLVEDAEHAKELEAAFDAVRKQRADDPLLRLLGLGQLLDRVRLQVDGTQLHVHLELTIAEAEIVADKITALREGRGEGDPDPSTAPAPAASAAPALPPSAAESGAPSVPSAPPAGASAAPARRERPRPAP